MERKVVVLPQPLGPSRVKSLPSGTSNETSCAAWIASPRSPAYSVYSDLTLSTFVSARPSTPGVCDPVSPADELRRQHETQYHDDQQHTESGQLDVLAVLPVFPDHDRNNFRSRAVEQD